MAGTDDLPWVRTPWPWPERYSCDGDKYHDAFDENDYVIGARPCQGCPSCQPELAEEDGER